MLVGLRAGLPAQRNGFGPNHRAGPVLDRLALLHLEVGNSAQKLLDADLDLKSRQVRAHAAVSAAGEGEVGLARTVEVDLTRVGERVGVVVTGGQDAGDLVAFFHFYAAH